MQDAQGAVPCWIMSHNKVSETLPATLGSFDLVVVDEASQSDLWALPAVLRGKKNFGRWRRQAGVTPMEDSLPRHAYETLKNRFLADQPYAAVLTPEKSLYDIASTVFAAQKVMLRGEHFRCVPAIIAYSNKFRRFHAASAHPQGIRAHRPATSRHLRPLWLPEQRTSIGPRQRPSQTK